MKQRVVVQTIIQNADKVLLLRRSQGRPGIIGKYELPGGALDDDEQPDDAIRRHIHTALGLHISVVTLRDAVSMNNREEGDIRHVFIVYEVAEVSENDLIHLGQSYDEYNWYEKTAIPFDVLRDSAAELLGLYDTSPKISRPSRKIAETPITVYSDGGSRGNPGPSAAAFVIYDQNNQVIDQGGEYLGITTNNQAEYHGVLLGLERALEHKISSLEYRVDSMLVVNQLNGTYHIKNRELWPIHERIKTLMTRFKKINFAHVPRERNQAADLLVNVLLDEHKNDERRS